jgi:ribose transport system permease protein
MPDTLVTPETDDKVTGPKSPKTGTAGRSGLAMLRTGSSRFALVGVWILMIGLYAILSPSLFPTSSTFTSIFNSQQVLVFLTCSLLCTIIVGEFVDLSVPSVLCLAATIVPVLSVQHGWSIPLACAFALAVCLVVGALQGALVVYMGVNTIVVTLGMSTFLLGIALWISNLNYVTGLPSSFANIDLANVFGLPISFYYGIAMMLVFAYILVFTPLGRHMRFVGSNREVSRLAGIRVNRIRFGAFVAAALVAGVGGIIASAGLGGFNPSDSPTYLLPTFAATFLGTAVVLPGKFNPLGTLIAIYFLATGVQGLEDIGAAGWIQDVFYGGVLVIAVAISTLVQRMLSGS